MFNSANLQKCQLRASADDAIMLVPEPENKVDIHAIAVKSLDGASLGYVPKEENTMPEFRGGVLFGHVQSSGPSRDRPEVSGFTVRQLILPALKGKENLTDAY